MRQRSKTTQQYFQEGLTDEDLVNIAIQASLKQINARFYSVWTTAIIVWLIIVNFIFVNFEINSGLSYFRISQLALFDSGFWTCLIALLVIPGSVVAGSGYRFIQRGVVYHADPFAYSLAESKGLISYYRYPIIGLFLGIVQMAVAIFIWNFPIVLFYLTNY